VVSKSWCQFFRSPSTHCNLLEGTSALHTVHTSTRHMSIACLRHLRKNDKDIFSNYHTPQYNFIKELLLLPRSIDKYISMKLFLNSAVLVLLQATSINSYEVIGHGIRGGLKVSYCFLLNFGYIVCVCLFVVLVSTLCLFNNMS